MVTFITLDALPGYLANTAIGVTTISVGNTTVNASMLTNSTSSYVSTPNTGLLVGTANIGAPQTNGYSYIPNGLILQWGAFVANTTSKITFSIPFPTACISLATSSANVNYNGANTIVINSQNTTVANATSASTNTGSLAMYLAIGN